MGTDGDCERNDAHLKYYWEHRFDCVREINTLVKSQSWNNMSKFRGPILSPVASHSWGAAILHVIKTAITAPHFSHQAGKNKGEHTHSVTGRTLKAAHLPNPTGQNVPKALAAAKDTGMCLIFILGSHMHR